MFKHKLLHGTNIIWRACFMVTFLVQGVGQEAIIAECAEHGFHMWWPGTRDPDGNARLLERASTPGGRGLEVVMLALVVKWLLAPEARDNLQPLIKQFGPHLAICLLAELGKAYIKSAQANG